MESIVVPPVPEKGRSTAIFTVLSVSALRAACRDPTTITIVTAIRPAHPIQARDMGTSAWLHLRGCMFVASC